MSTFDTLASTALAPVLLSTHGTSTTYTPRGASSGTVYTAVPSELPGEEGVRRRRYRYRSSHVTAPVVGDQVTDGTETWLVYEVHRPAGGLVALDCEITEDRG